MIPIAFQLFFTRGRHVRAALTADHARQNGVGPRFELLPD
jgi:hypothetical protein